jgi:hypothetical protein
MAKSLNGVDFKNFSIEHIMPETKNEKWAYIPDEGYQGLISSIGNLTLVSQPINAAMQNNAFEFKQEIYGNDPCPLTKSLASPIRTITKNTIFDKSISAFNYDPVPSKWDEPEISRRAESIVNLAEYVWFRK